MAEKRTRSGCLLEGYQRGGAIRTQPGAIVYHLGLGSNQGDRGGHIEKAVEFLQGCGRVLKRSAVYETTPLAMPGSGLFLNMVMASGIASGSAGPAEKMQDS